MIREVERQTLDGRAPIAFAQDHSGRSQPARDEFEVHGGWTDLAISYIAREAYRRKLDDVDNQTDAYHAVTRKFSSGRISAA